MSGHSKWATIHRAKAITDVKRGAVFTKLANAIIVAVRAGGNIGDPDKNFKLRIAVDRARAVSMPKENIDRAIKKALGAGEGANFEELVYEAFAPGGVGLMIEATTDNKQRTAQEVKNILEKNGGSLGSQGSVAFQFKRSGLITIEKPQNIEDAILEIIDMGADDVEEAEDVIEIYASAENLEDLKAKLKEANYNVTGFEMVLRPTTIVPVNDPNTARRVLDLIEKLEDSQDVQKVFANFEIPDNLIS